MKNIIHYMFRQSRLLMLESVGCLLLNQASSSAQETLRQYLCGIDAEHPVQWDFFCSGGRNSGVWTKIAVGISGFRGIPLRFQRCEL